MVFEVALSIKGNTGCCISLNIVLCSSGQSDSSHLLATNRGIHAWIRSEFEEAEMKKEYKTPGILNLGRVEELTKGGKGKSKGKSGPAGS